MARFRFRQIEGNQRAQNKGDRRAPFPGGEIKEKKEKKERTRNKRTLSISYSARELLQPTHKTHDVPLVQQPGRTRKRPAPRADPDTSTPTYCCPSRCKYNGGRGPLRLPRRTFTPPPIRNFSSRAKQSTPLGFSPVISCSL